MIVCLIGLGLRSERDPIHPRHVYSNVPGDIEEQPESPLDDGIDAGILSLITMDNILFVFFMVSTCPNNFG